MNNAALSLHYCLHHMSTEMYTKYVNHNTFGVDFQLCSFLLLSRFSLVVQCTVAAS